jgi:hypothetical protein
MRPEVVGPAEPMIPAFPARGRARRNRSFPLQWGKEAARPHPEGRFRRLWAASRATYIGPVRETVSPARSSARRKRKALGRFMACPSKKGNGGFTVAKCPWTASGIQPGFEETSFKTRRSRAARTRKSKAPSLRAFQSEPSACGQRGSRRYGDGQAGDVGSGRTAR